MTRKGYSTQQFWGKPVYQILTVLSYWCFGTLVVGQDPLSSKPSEKLPNQPFVGKRLCSCSSQLLKCFSLLKMFRFGSKPLLLLQVSFIHYCFTKLKDFNIQGKLMIKQTHRSMGSISYQRLFFLKSSKVYYSYWSWSTDNFLEKLNPRKERLKIRVLLIVFYM